MTKTSFLILCFALISCADQPTTHAPTSTATITISQADPIEVMRATLLAGGHPPKELWVTFALGNSLSMHWFFTEAEAKAWIVVPANIEQFHGPFSGPHHATLNGYKQ